MSSSFTDMSDKPLKPKKTFRDRVEKFFGKGRFGKVVECVDTKTDENVAIKMTTDYFQENARKEAADADRSHIIVHDEPTCPSFEVVDVTLDEYLKDVQFMTISEIRPVLQQLATALLCLEDLDIVHSDINPENIMVLDKWQKPLQVKLIDFGLACQGPDIHPGSGGQSLLYRAPEVMLGLRHRQPIDMWSVGLTVAEMALGRPLLPGKHEYDIMKKIVKTLGEPPTDQLDAGPRSMQYFNICGTWRLKTSLELHARTGLHYSDRKCFNSSCTLEEIMYQGLIAEDEEEVEHFIDLLKKMLNVNKNERITPAQVLKHPFLAVEQHGDGPHMTVTMEEPYVPQQPEPLTSEEVHPSTPGINVSSNLDVTLDEYVKDVKFMTISEIRPVLQQLATALLCLEDLDIVHSDIKPENILVLDKWQKPLQVKLIDFGLACQGPDIHPGSGGQSLLYRAPEVMLGLRHRQPIDMWSVGLTVAEMALGRPLLPGKHEYDIMKNIVNMLGEPPIYQLDAGPRSMQYFNICRTWRLKTSEELHARTGLHYSDRKCFNYPCALEEIMYQGLIAEDEEEVEHFIDLLKKMLKVNKNERITPAQVLKHPFLAVEQHGDGPHMTVTMEEPYVPQQPEPLTTEEVHPSPPKTTSLDLEDEEVTAAPVQPTVPQQPEPLTSEEVHPSPPKTTSLDLEDEEVTAAPVQPTVPQQPEPLTSEEVYPSPPKTTSLDLEDEEVTAAPVQPTVPQQPEPLTSEEVYPSTPGINVSSNLEDEEETTASVQPEVVTKSRRKSASRRVRTFFKRVKKAWCSCFNCCTKMP